jgi:hypothetical protein
MCDYSLHAIPNRLSVEGEQLVTHRFPTFSIGLASPADLEKAVSAHRESQKEERSWWMRFKIWFSQAPVRSEEVPAVCIPPGARLLLRDIPEETRQEFAVGPVEEVTFTELTPNAYRYRDGVRFDNGREVLLQHLREGLSVDVLSLALAEPDYEPLREQEV